MKKLLAIHDAPSPHWVGDGFPVRTLFSYDRLGAHVSPFLLLDYAGPVVFEPAARPRGVGPHPHRGFETVTLVYEGELEHRDSTGAGGRIGPGDVQWMTAGAGILHEELHSREFTRTGGTLEMVQLWVNLPARHKTESPAYQTLLRVDIPSLPLPGGAGELRVIAGEHEGARGPARTFTPVGVWDLRLLEGREAALELPDGHTLALAVLRGSVRVQGAATAGAGQLALLGREGSRLALAADSDASVLVLSGEPIDEPLVGYGPFVMNTQAEIERAIADFEAGRFGQLSS